MPRAAHLGCIAPCAFHKTDFHLHLAPALAGALAGGGAEQQVLIKEEKPLLGRPGASASDNAPNYPQAMRAAGSISKADVRASHPKSPPPLPCAARRPCRPSPSLAGEGTCKPRQTS